MIVTYLRSSSLNTFEWCPHKYFCEYVLGIKSVSNQAADIGTIVHKVMEIFARAKKAKQSGHRVFDDDLLGFVNVKDCNNIASMTKSVYDAKVKELTAHSWGKTELKKCIEHVQVIVNFNNGLFDPRTRNIVQCEQFFDLEIKKDWAKYDYTIGLQNFTGHLAIKGTIDLITEVDDETYEVIDYKTGRYRTNFATGKVKELEDFYNDIQLRLYHYALSKIYPKIKTFVVTIFWTQAGGPFTVMFQQSDILVTEEMLRRRSDEIREVSVPRLNKSWRCTKVCYYGKNSFSGSNCTVCEEIHNHNKTKGVVATINKYGDINSINRYGTGAGRTQD